MTLTMTWSTTYEQDNDMGHNMNVQDQGNWSSPWRCPPVVWRRPARLQARPKEWTDKSAGLIPKSPTICRWYRDMIRLNKRFEFDSKFNSLQIRSPPNTVQNYLPPPLIWQKLAQFILQILKHWLNRLVPKTWLNSLALSLNMTILQLWPQFTCSFVKSVFAPDSRSCWKLRQVSITIVKLNLPVWQFCCANTEILLKALSTTSQTWNLSNV